MTVRRYVCISTNLCRTKPTTNTYVSDLSMFVICVVSVQGSALTSRNYSEGNELGLRLPEKISHRSWMSRDGITTPR